MVGRNKGLLLVLCSLAALLFIFKWSVIQDSSFTQARLPQACRAIDMIEMKPDSPFWGKVLETFKAPILDDSTVFAQKNKQNGTGIVCEKNAIYIAFYSPKSQDGRDNAFVLIQHKQNGQLGLPGGEIDNFRDDFKRMVTQNAITGNLSSWTYQRSYSKPLDRNCHHLYAKNTSLEELKSMISSAASSYSSGKYFSGYVLLALSPEQLSMYLAYGLFPTPIVDISYASRSLPVLYDNTLQMLHGVLFNPQTGPLVSSETYREALRKACKLLRESSNFQSLELLEFASHVLSKNSGN